jgi:hypothetical protein
MKIMIKKMGFIDKINRSVLLIKNERSTRNITMDEVESRVFHSAPKLYLVK